MSREKKLLIVKAAGRTLLAAVFCAAQIPAAALPVSAEEAFAFFEQEAKAITATRKLQSVQESPVAIDVITAEDIRMSGARTLWDFLRFRPGVDIVEGRSFDGNRAIVSVRGFPEEFTRSLLVLVDGRVVYSALNQGVYWQQLSVQIQDIERIEIVRGPNSALYGPNAAQGVINIITRKPESSSLSVHSEAGSLDWLHSGFSVQQAGEKFGHRWSYDYETQDGFPLSGTGSRANDGLLGHKGNFRGWGKIFPGAQVEIFGGGAWTGTGQLSSANSKHNTRNDFGMLRWTQDLNSWGSFEGSFSGEENKIKIDPGVFDSRYLQYDTEGLHRFNWAGERMETTWGGSYRHVSVNSREFFLSSPQSREGMWLKRWFVSNRAALPRRLALFTSFSKESLEPFGAHENAFQSALVATTQEGNSFRLSYSLANTIPSLFRLTADYRPSSSVRLMGNPEMSAEKLYSYEAGSRLYFLERRLRTDASLFYMDRRGISQSFTQSAKFFPPPVLITLSYDNIHRAIARGAELAADYRWSRRLQISGNYTYERIQEEHDNLSLIRSTPKHKINFGGTVFPAPGWSLRVQAGRKSGYLINSPSRSASIFTGIPSFWRVDARLAYAPRPRWEGFLSAQNITNSSHAEFADGLEIPRTWQAGISVLFGGAY